MTDPQTYLLTTPIYYVNDVPHVGHAYTTIAADALTRARRLAGKDAYLLTGTDEHGQNIERIARERGVSEQQHADEIAARFRGLWERLDIRPPTYIVVLKPDHVRDVDLFARRHSVPAFGPSLFWRHDVPETELEPIEPENELPGGAVALYDGRGRNETPLWVPERRALVFADALTERGGKLRIWGTPWHEERVLPALRAMLDLPFEHVIVSHGDPCHDRTAFEHALELPPWEG